MSHWLTSSRKAVLFRWIVMAPATVAIGIACISIAQVRLDAKRGERFDEELLYIPNEKLLNHFTAGHNTVVADLLWLKCVQYTAREFRSKYHKFTWLEHICNTVVRLDPQFAGAYQMGGTLLAAIDADAAAYSLLERGVVKRPDRWELPLEIAKIYILNRRDEPGSPAAASYFLTWAAEKRKIDNREDAEFLLRWAESIQLQHNLIADGKRIWQSIYETTNDDFMKELAERKLQELGLREVCDILNQVVEHYVAQTGEKPGRILDLETAGLITGTPTDPLGGEFVIEDGVVYSTTLLDVEVERRLRGLRGAIARFKKEHERWPRELDELKTMGVVLVIPEHPYSDRGWLYNPHTGEIE